MASEARSHTSKNQPNVIMPIAMLYHMMACTMNKVDFLCNSRLLGGPESLRVVFNSICMQGRRE